MGGKLNTLYRQQPLSHIHQPQYSKSGMHDNRQQLTSRTISTAHRPSRRLLQHGHSIPHSFLSLICQVRRCRCQVLYGVLVCYGFCLIEVTAYSSLGSTQYTRQGILQFLPDLKIDVPSKDVQN